ncbi:MULTISPECIES: IS110 family transposase [Dehalobacter]|uniref:IS110 family transposase n=1 Tax=Dehalobacter restrictus TaxID=55583 RepID=A0A857DF40_9FIRM|nr:MULTISPECIES: IS110 family transposase [Dehalobacter]AFV03941.1 putative transposase [Dehalobacter sp. DCA]AFV05302.1 putative transposase [Dehalobacter sp. CF]AFV05802.1 putative transposase [Dehalobacter sp. CF]AFV06211.1 putative transposase [Dehalobacter sp. CF]AFV06920.1 putative transposase [Dehalobacter sp. CF]
MSLFVGIDVSSSDFKVRILDERGNEPVKKLRALNDQPGCEQVTRYLSEACAKENEDRLVIGLEATSVYSWPLQMFLAEDPCLAPLQPQIYSFNPKVVANFKKAYVDLPKNDWIDAWVIAERLRFGRLPEGSQVDFRYLPLQRLTRFRCHMIEMISREKNYFLTNLFLKFSTLAQGTVFSNTFGATSESLTLEFFSPEEVAARPLDELIDFLMEKGKSHFEDPEAKARELKEAARKAHRLRGSLLQPINLILATSIETIHTLEKQVKKIDKAIEAEIRHFSNTLITVPGIGPVLSAGIIAEIGDIRRFPNEGALAKFIGLTWRSHQSGDFTADDTPLTRTGNTYLRSYIIQAANLVRQKEPEYKAFYQRKFSESKTHHHRRALVLTARKLVRMVDALLRSNQIYMPHGNRGNAN